MTQKKNTSRRSFLTNSAKAAAAVTALPALLQQAIAEATPASELARNLALDPRRPQFHLLPAANWMNDPNGPIFWKGKYHMFFQYNPHAAVWGDMHWNHAISPDMIHWRHLPVVLAPTPGGPDADGCFSGTAVVNNGVPTFIYTGVQKVPADRAEAEATLRDGHNDFKETQLYATSTDPELRTWTKRPTPVIPKPPEGMKVTGFRDPAPWKENLPEPSLANGAWLLAVGSGTREKGGCVLLYKSTYPNDLQTWEYLHVVAGGNGQTNSDAANPVDSGDMWECPDLFPLGNKHVLIYSTQGKVFWKIGTLAPSTLLFHEEQSGLLDHGSFYAPKTQLDKAGNRILWGWIPETRPEAEFSASGWAGLMSIPRVLTVGPDGRLKITPLPTLDKLRKSEQKLSLTPSKSGEKELLGNLRLKDACGEILCTIQPTQPFTLDLISPLLTPIDPKDTTAVSTQQSYLSIRYSHANPKELVVDQQRLPINLTPGNPLELHFYIDGSVIELFVNNQATLTKRFYYPGPTAPEIAVSITGNRSDITRLSQWQLTPITKDRLTT
jgi:beta-fructofuranosidase